MEPIVAATYHGTRGESVAYGRTRDEAARLLWDAMHAASTIDRVDPPTRYYDTYEAFADEIRYDDAVVGTARCAGVGESTYARVSTGLVPVGEDGTEGPHIGCDTAHVVSWQDHGPPGGSAAGDEGARPFFGDLHDAYAYATAVRAERPMAHIVLSAAHEAVVPRPAGPAGSTDDQDYRRELDRADAFHLAARTKAEFAPGGPVPYAGPPKTAPGLSPSPFGGPHVQGPSGNIL